ncbi:MAG: Ig-like domain-containing protein [Acidobacteria bacterium]|nr:Ig-like domain-containing protein [Acidobacteriota bacterium]
MTLRPSCLSTACALVALAGPLLSAEIGGGAPTPQVQLSYQNAYQRGSFRFGVNPVPPNDIRSFGGTGFLQEFIDLARPTQRAALIYGVPVPVEGVAVQTFQLSTGMYAYYSGGAGGFATAGFPVEDTRTFSSGSTALAGEWQTFQKTLALFTWSTTPDPVAASVNFTVRDPFYSRWVLLGSQRFQNGAAYYYTAGSLTGRLLAVTAPIAALYRDNGAEAGLLGLPLSDELVLPDGRRQQRFEGGTVVYRTGEAPTILPAVTQVTILGPNPLRLAPGQKATVRAELVTALAQFVTDRAVTFTVSNGRVATVRGDGLSAEVTAVGPGVATLTATSEGIVSAAVPIQVSSVCCALGEGAGTAVSDAMQAAVTRNRLTLRTPLAAPARRVGGGWLQEALSASGTIRYLVTKADTSANAFVLTGALLPVWEQGGGAGGSLGYPASDLSVAGRQMFERGALAGNPVQLVTGAILSRWGQLDFETGLVGDPASAASSFLTFNATTGRMQFFKSGLIVETTRTAVVTGRILARYIQLGGPSGRLGVPVGDEFQDGARRRQNFEGGALSYTSAEPEVRLDENARRPQITATPAVVAPGNRLLLALGGFADGAQVRVSFPGSTQPPFLVTLPTGAYTWELIVPAGARAETVTLQAVDTARPGVLAAGSYAIRAATDLRLAKASGDLQNGAPGGLLPQFLRVTLTDAAGAPLAGQAVRWEASPGAQIVSAAAVTDQQGQAVAGLRLPRSEGVALATAPVGTQIVTFSARSAARSLANFTRYTQSDGGALVAVLASVLRFRQQAGAWGTPQGLADVATLNGFLKAFCTNDVNGAAVCDGYLPAGNSSYANLARLTAFTGGNLDLAAEPLDTGRLRDLAAADEPVVVALSVAGQAHFVVTTGVGAGGETLIHDPNPAYGRTTLDEYLTGFTGAGGTPLKGTLSAAFRLVPRPASSDGFHLYSSSSFRLQSAGAECQPVIAWPGLSQTFCDGVAGNYQLQTEANTRVILTSLGAPAARLELGAATAATYRLTRGPLVWTGSPQELTFGADTVLNSATYQPGLTPGGAFSVFGTGLSGATVELAGQPAAVLFSNPFQLNAVVPPALAPGLYPVRVRSALGDQTQTLEVQPTAPAIFMMPDGGAAIVTADNTLNRPANPVRRGQVIVIYLTGLGAVERRAGLDWARTAVVALLGGRTLTPQYAGTTPGSPGLYQVNLTIPADLAPGLRLPLRLRQGGQESNLAEIAVQ